MTKRLHPALADIPLRYLQAHGGLPPDINAAAIASPDGVPTAMQRRMLGELAQRGGEGLLLTLATQTSELRQEPLLFIMLNACSVADFLTKEQRFNRYFHSDHRIRILNSGQSHVELQHYGLEAAPTRHESLFVLGIHLEMFAAIGCRGLVVRFPGSHAPHQALAGPPFCDPPQGDVSSYHVAWEHFVQNRPPLAGLDELLLSKTTPRDFASEESIVTRLQRLIDNDLAHRWTTAEAATGLHTSVRTLQRELTAAGTAFTRELEQARVAKAKHLLADPKRAIAEVGYLCGFSNGPHFSRRFKAATGVTPAAWRTATKE